MSTQTLAEAAKLINNQIVHGVVEDLIDLNPMFALMPFDGYDGQAIVLNREVDTVLTATNFRDVYAVGSAITSKAPMQYVNYTYTATKIIGDAEMDGLVQASSQSAGVDQIANEISSKGKAVGHRFQNGMAVDDGSTPNMNSFHSLCDSGSFTDTDAGSALSFDKIDETFDLVKSKHGTVDWAMLPKRTIRAYKALLRSLGGTPGDWIQQVPYADGRTRTVITYEGTPIFKNEHLSIVETADGAALTGGALTSLWAGCWDDGTRRVGMAGIYPSAVPAGIAVQSVGTREDYDEDIWRVKWYANLAMYSRKGLARGTSINN